MEIETISTTVQAICAVVAIIVTIAISYQTIKIRELADVTDALIEQTKEIAKQTKLLVASNDILQKHYELENLLSLRNRIPFFIRSSNTNQFIETRGQHMLHIKNTGTKAFNITFMQNEDSKNIYSISLHSNERDTKEVMQIDVIYNRPELSRKYYYNFCLKFLTEENQEMYQQIVQDDNQIDSFRIHPPQVVPTFEELMEISQ